MSSAKHVRTKEERIYLLAALWPEAGQWMAECLQLGAAASGDSLAEAIRKIEEASIAVIKTLDYLDLEERVQFFARHGIEIRPATDPIPVPPVPRAYLVAHPDVMFHLMELPRTIDTR